MLWYLYRLLAGENRHHVALRERKAQAHKKCGTVFHKFLVQFGNSFFKQFGKLVLKFLHRWIALNKKPSPFHTRHDLYHAPEYHFFIVDKAQQQANDVVVALAITKFYVKTAICLNYIFQFLRICNILLLALCVFVPFINIWPWANLILFDLLYQRIVFHRYEFLV